MSINNADLETNRNTAYSTYQKQGKSANQTAAINLCGLIKLVGKRLALLDYLKDRDIERYRAIIKALNIRK